MNRAEHKKHRQGEWLAGVHNLPITCLPCKPSCHISHPKDIEGHQVCEGPIPLLPSPSDHTCGHSWQ
jgi:hypothetical protein